VDAIPPAENPVHEASPLAIGHDNVQVGFVVQGFDEAQDVPIVTQPLHSLNLLEGVFVPTLLQVFDDGTLGQTLDGDPLGVFFGWQSVDSIPYPRQDDSEIHRPPSRIVVAQIDRWHFLYPHVGVLGLLRIFVHDIDHHTDASIIVVLIFVVVSVTYTLVVVVVSSVVVVGRKNDKILGIGDALVDDHVPQHIFLLGRLGSGHVCLPIICDNIAD
jgi:hypothetical protein